MSGWYWLQKHGINCHKFMFYSIRLMPCKHPFIRHTNILLYISSFKFTWGNKFIVFFRLSSWGFKCHQYIQRFILINWTVVHNPNLNDLQIYSRKGTKFLRLFAHILLVVNNVVDIGGQISLQDPDFNYFD